MSVRDAKTNARARATLPLPGRRRRRKAGDLEALKREVWHAILAAADMLDDPDAEMADRLRAANAVASLAGVYRSVYADADLLPRLEAIEARLASERGGRR